jgi:hypothetical protein
MIIVDRLVDNYKLDYLGKLGGKGEFRISHL